MRHDEAEASSTVKSADRTLDLFELLARWGREMSHTEIAEALDCRRGTVKSLASRALKTLAKEIEQ